MSDAVLEEGTPSTTPHQFPELLRSHRVRVRLTQRELADLSTVSLRAIRDLEAGRARGRTTTVHLLADVLKLQGLARELFVHAGLSHKHGAQYDAVGPALPKPVSALVGRDAEVRAMTDALESGRRRMLSISGLAGVGKTRIVAEIANRLNSRRRWPVLWLGRPAVTQVRARDDGTALAPLTHALRSLIESGAEDAEDAEDAERVCRLVGQHEVLLVLNGVADDHQPWFVEELLAYCPGVRVISTSRAPWQVTGVLASVINPLDTPGPEWDASACVTALTGVPSVRLLVDRLAEVRPGFVLGPANAPAVVEICRRLDGLPLALEAVAGCFRVIGLPQLLELPVPALLDLSVQAGPGAERETIGGLIGWSFERLDVERRAILKQLVESDRVWTVQEVAAQLSRPAVQVVDDLSVLIGFGLIRAHHGEHASGLHIPNLLRAFLLRTLGDGRQPHNRGVEPVAEQKACSIRPRSMGPTKGAAMSYDPAQALRDAGILSGTMRPELEEFYGSLSKSETDVLISLKNRLAAVLPEVEAHEWTKPEATAQGFEAAMLCMCSIWSGAGEAN